MRKKILLTIAIILCIVTAVFPNAATIANTIVINKGGVIKLCANNSLAVAYQWFKNGKPIPLAIGNICKVTEPGIYTVVGYNSESCPSETSDPIEVKYAEAAMRDLWITANNISRSYGSANPLFTFTYDGFAEGDSPDNLKSLPVAITTANTISGAGKYDIVPTGASSDKYSIHYKTGTLTITQAQLIVTAKNDNKSYDGQPYQDNIGVNYAGFVNGETPDVLGGSLLYMGDAIGAINTGAYAIIPGGVTSDNYQIAYLPGTLNITSRTVDLAAIIFSEKKSVEIGEEFDYTITATNKNSRATNVMLKDMLTQDIEFVAVSRRTTGTVNYNQDSHNLDWSIGDFDPNGTAELVIRVRSVKSGDIMNTVLITSDETDSNLTNNTFSDYKAINGLKIPNIFTPNGDGMNDAFVIPGLANYPDNEITVFNRLGNNVFTKKAYQNNWTGDGLSDGTYFYMLKIKITNERTETYKGYITILRSNSKLAGL